MVPGKYQKYLAIVVVSVGALIGGCFVVYANLEELLPCSLINTNGLNWSQMTKKEQDCREVQNAEEERQQIEAGKQAEIDSQTWPEYRNEKLGIAIRYPEPKDSDDIVFISAGDILFVRSSSSALYQRRTELPESGDGAIVATARAIQTSSKDIFDTNSPHDWEIHVFDVGLDADLQKIIDTWYGKDRCVFTGLRPAKQDGVFDVTFKDKYPPTGEDNEADGSCWINWQSILRYSPTLHRAAVWDIGQDAHFPYKGCESLACSADDPMADSFRFI